MPHTRERLRRFLIRAMSRTHSGVYRASGGRLLGRVVGMPVLLLTTSGRRSGKPRTAALTYFRDGADLVVIGSFGGSDLPPAWWLNLQRDPHASVVIGGTTSWVTARAATAEEHDRLWPLVTTTHPGYARYQERTARLIPVVMLMPEDAGHNPFRRDAGNEPGLIHSDRLGRRLPSGRGFASRWRRR
jgi:F420H(2)-dependent quinone reductase